MKHSDTSSKNGSSCSGSYLLEAQDILFNASADGIFITDSQGRVLVVNPQGSRLTGYSREQILTMVIPDLVSLEEPVRELISSGEPRPGGAVPREGRVHRRDGTLLPVEVSIESLSGGNQLFIVRDISERLRAEEALRKSEDRFRALIENAGTAGAVVDREGVTEHRHPGRDRLAEKHFEEKLAHSHELMRYIIEHANSAVAVHDRELRYIYVSQNYLNQYRVKERDVIGKHHYEVFPDLPRKWREVHRRALAGEVSRADRDPYERADGTVEWTRWECRPWYEADHSIGGIIVYTEVITERVRAEETHAELSRLLEDSFNEIYVFDAETLCFVQVNNGARRNLGYSMNELRSLTPLDLKPEFDSQAFAEMIRPLQTGAAPRIVFETRHRRKNGSFYEVEVHLQKAMLEGRPVFVAIIIDITERKRAETERLLNEARFRSLANVLQYQGADTQDFLDFALREALALTGSKLGYIYFYHEDRREFVLNTWSRDVMQECSVANPQTCYNLDKTGIWGEAVRQRRPILLNDFQAAHPLKRGYPEGHARLHRYLTVPVFSGERIVAVVGMANKERDYDEQDVHQVRLLMDAVWKVVEQRRALEALRDSEERFASFMRHLPGFAYLKDDQRRILFVNELFETAFGIPLPDWQGKTNDEIWPGKVGEKIRDDDEAVLAEGAPRATVEQVPTRGEPRTYRTVKFPIPRSDGRPWLGGISVDITELKQAEEALRTSLEEKESLLKEVHHRVKNNLQVISSLLNLQFRQVRNEEVRSFLRDTQNRIRSMAMLHEILYLSGNIVSISFPFYVKKLCNHLIRSHGFAARNIRLRHRVADVPLNPDQAITAGLIVNELVTNAIKHAFPSGGGGDIFVELRAEHGNHLLLRVADNGIGLPADMPPQAADSLGLLLVRNLCRQLDGHLSVRGEPGTVFDIVFPLAPEEGQNT